jgi:GNAT superfamily N-acetyltransferase
MGEFKLVHCDNQNLLDEMHNIRERVLFTDGKYDRHHPDDTNPDNQCFVFLLNDKPIATVRLDFIRPQEYAIRFVAVLPEYQGKKIGSKMMNSIIDYANQKGIYKLVTNAAIEATKFYESLGFVKEYWIDTGEEISRPTIPMVKILNPKLVQATLSDYPIIQNMARFYVYDLSRYCGYISDEWACPPDGLYTDTDLKHYFQDPERCAYLIKMR